MDATQAELAELRQRLYEAEETIRAIREGEVDALVIEGTRSAEVFTIEGGREPYRVFMEAMGLGAAALDGAQRLLYANSALCALLNRSSEDLQGTGLFEALGETASATLRDMLAEGGAQARSAELRVPGEREELHLHVSAAPLQLGPTDGTALTFTDLTEQQRNAAIEESERVARAVIASANEAVVVCDREGRITHVNGAVLAITARTPLGRRFDEAIPLVLSGMTGLLAGEDLIAMAVGGGMVQGVEAQAPDAPRARSLLVSAAPLVVSGNDVRGCVVTMVDLSQRKEAERQQLLIMRELDHRVKNTLALVMSICTRTASSEETVEGFRKAFLGRIHALAATHNLLSETSWADLNLKSVVSAELAPYVIEGDGRLSLRGLDVLITPRAATALGLIFHELATNAAKYGALSTQTGCVAIQARLDRAAQKLTVSWTEANGPEVSEPARHGFGQTVIARSLSYAEDGAAELIFDRSGVTCRIDVPWQDVSPPS